MKPLVLGLFDRSGSGLDTWLRFGYDVMVVDIASPRGQYTADNGVVVVGADLNHWVPPLNRSIAFIMAYPPCTHLAVSGARWFKGKGLHLLADSIRLFARAAEICESAGCPYAIENPVSTVSTYWRKPDYTFHPYEYGGWSENPDEEAYTKKTCLWVGGGFTMPEPRPVEPVKGSYILNPPPSEDRQVLRCRTPRGFVIAASYANLPADRPPVLG